MHRTRTLIVGVLGDEAVFDQFLAAAEIGLCIFERRLVALRLRIRLLERGLKVARIDLVEEIAALDVGAVGGGLSVDVARHARLQGDAADRFDPAGIVEVDRQRLLDHRDDRDGHRHHCGRRGRSDGADAAKVMAGNLDACDRGHAERGKRGESQL